MYVFITASGCDNLEHYLHVCPDGSSRVYENVKPGTSDLHVAYTKGMGDRCDERHVTMAEFEKLKARSIKQNRLLEPYWELLEIKWWSDGFVE